MPTVSLSFLLAIGAVAAASGFYSLIDPDPVYSVTAVVLGLYAVHGLGLRLAIRQRGDPQKIQRECEVLQAELEQESARLEEERAERSALEQQWIGMAAGGGRRL